MYRLLRLPIRTASTANVFLRTYASRQTTRSLTEGERYIFNKLTKELEPFDSWSRTSQVCTPSLSPQLRFVLINAYCGFCGLYTMFCVCVCVPCLGGCGSFYAITVASEKLKGLPILKQHRRIKGVLKDDMAGLHGLQVPRLNPLVTNYLTNFRASVPS